MQHASIQGRVRGGEREKDREATRERETCNTSNQGRVRERERDMQHASIQGRVRGGEREKDREATERGRERHAT